MNRPKATKCFKGPRIESDRRKSRVSESRREVLTAPGGGYGHRAFTLGALVPWLGSAGSGLRRWGVGLR
jgi:hypothetical protein